MAFKFHVTTGDLDGVGLEVTLKALPQVLSKSKNSCFIIWIHESQKKTVNTFLSKNVSVKKESVFINKYEPYLIIKKFNFLVNKQAKPATWFSKAVDYCLKYNDGIITAPLSKTQIAKEGYNVIGHTEILKDKCKSDDLKMAFVGKHFSMILYTGHIPVSKVRFESKSFTRFMNLCMNFHNNFKSKSSEFKVLGLNPHAGDSGLIGNDDTKILKLLNQKYSIKNLLPADSAFIDYKKFKSNPTFVSLYHDQGLIPFKMAHGFTGFHFTLGLPFVRTSVDHGTAKDIFNLNKADPRSMVDSILGAIKLKTNSVS